MVPGGESGLRSSVVDGCYVIALHGMLFRLLPGIFSVKVPVEVGPVIHSIVGRTATNL